ncbi:MAG: PqqD family peptide modification chaperone [Bacillota bacterium]
MAVAPEVPQWVYVDTVGKSVIEACDGNSTVQEIVSAVCTRFAADPAQSTEHILSFLGELTTKGFLSTDAPRTGAGDISTERPPVDHLNQLWLHLTHSCNLRCIHCFREAGPITDELTPGEWKKALDGYSRLKGKGVIISGGEPLLRHDVLEILGMCEELNLQAGIITNGTLLTRELCKELSRMRKVSVQISLDGATRATVDKIRGSGVFDSVIRNYRELRSSGFNGPVSFSMTIMKPTLHEIEAFAELAAAEHANAVHFPFFTASGRGNKNRESLDLSETEKQEATCRLDRVMARANSLGVRFSRDCTALQALSTRRHDYCAAGVYGWSIEPNGNVTPCAGLTDHQYIAGNIRSRAFEEIVGDSPIARQFRSYRMQNSECSTCEVRFLCAGGCHINKHLAGIAVTDKDPNCSWYRSWSWLQIIQCARSTAQASASACLTS